MSAPNRKSQDGIDIRLALEILSQRQQKKPNSRGAPISGPQTPGTGNNEEHIHTAACGCQVQSSFLPKDVAETTQKMGQVLSLYDDEENEDARKATETQDREQQKQATEGQNERRMKRQEELRKRVESMDLCERIQTVLKAQEERVASYRVFERYVLEDLLLAVESSKSAVAHRLCCSLEACKLFWRREMFLLILLFAVKSQLPSPSYPKR